MHKLTNDTHTDTFLPGWKVNAGQNLNLSSGKAKSFQFAEQTLDAASMSSQKTQNIF